MNVVRQAESSDLAKVVEIHALSFSDTFLTFLGHRALKAYYNFFINQAEAIFLVIEEDDVVAGFILGWARGASYQTSMIRQSGWRFACAGLGSFVRSPVRMWLFIKPRLWFISRFIKLWLSLPVMRLVQIFGDKPTKVVGQAPPKFKASILSVAVLPEKRGRGLGIDLMRAAIKYCQSYEVPGITLTVEKENFPARRYYEAFGWEIFRESETAYHYQYVFE